MNSSLTLVTNTQNFKSLRPRCSCSSASFTTGIVCLRCHLQDLRSTRLRLCRAMISGSAMVTDAQVLMVHNMACPASSPRQ
jgi:hypothetical protein